MDRRQYFVECLQAGKYRSKRWIFSVFTLNKNVPTPEDKNKLVTGADQWLSTGEDFNYEIMKNSADEKGVYFVDPNNNGALTKIDDAVVTEPIFRVKDRITLHPGDLANVGEEIETTYGNALINAMVLVWPFGNKVPFITGRISGSALEEKIGSRLKDTPPEGTERDPAFLYVDEFLKYCEAMSSLAGLAPINVPSASRRSMTVDPAVVKRRDELLEQYKDQLSDPAIVARIEEELAELDKSQFKGDPAEGFYISKKGFEVNRKRQFVMVGTESGFGDTKRGVKPITNSLQEGWQIEYLPEMADSLRSGSFNRGSQTALGGESVKYFYRIFQNTRVAEEDCGTNGGITRLITKDNWKAFLGLHLVPTGDRSPDTTRLTEEKIKSFIGQRIKIRSPMICKTEGASFCARCVGDALARSPTGLHIAFADVGSIFMLSFMKAMHGKALRTARYDPRISIT